MTDEGSSFHPTVSASKGFRPAGRVALFRDGCYFLLAQKVTKDALGDGSDERLRAAGAHSHCPQTPITGDAFLENWHLRPAAPNTRPCVLLASGALAPSGAEIGKHLRCTDTAYSGKAVAAGPPTTAALNR